MAVVTEKVAPVPVPPVNAPVCPVVYPVVPPPARVEVRTAPGIPAAVSADAAVNSKAWPQKNGHVKL